MSETPRTPAIVWVVGDGEGDCLFAASDEQPAKDHFQHCVDEDSDFRSGPYTLTEYVPKRDLAAALEEKKRAEARNREWAPSLNRRAEVEQVLFDCAQGKRALPTREECHALATKLGVPEEWLAERDAAAQFQLERQSRESVEAEFYRYLRDVAGQVNHDRDGPMICSGLGDQFDYLRGEECDQALREAIDKHRAVTQGIKSP